MKEPNKKIETSMNPDQEEEVNINETDDIKVFIRKTQLQNRVLRKITETLRQSNIKEKEENSPEQESSNHNLAN
jgi:hypothetical protein